jgi:hypothetical protein
MDPIKKKHQPISISIEQLHGLGVVTPISPGSTISLAGMSITGEASARVGYIGQLHLAFEVKEVVDADKIKDPFQPGRSFRYHRGGIVTILGTATHAEDPRPTGNPGLDFAYPEVPGDLGRMVVYRTEKGQIRFRPREEFLVDVEYNGQMVPCFTPLTPGGSHHHE